MLDLTTIGTCSFPRNIEQVQLFWIVHVQAQQAADARAPALWAIFKGRGGNNDGPASAILCFHGCLLLQEAGLLCMSVTGIMALQEQQLKQCRNCGCQRLCPSVPTLRCPVSGRHAWAAWFFRRRASFIFSVAAVCHLNMLFGSLKGCTGVGLNLVFRYQVPAC